MKRVAKERKKINPFDVIVIILIVCLLVTFAYRIYAGVADESHRNEIKYVMEFECEEEYDSLLNHLSEGDAVYFASNGRLLGYLYAGEDSENGAVYGIVSDIPTFAGDGELDIPQLSASEFESETDETSTESESLSESESISELESTSKEAATESESSEGEQKDAVALYKKIKIGGTIRLNIETVRVKSGNYYSIEDTNFVEGSVIEVYTDKAVFTLKVVNVTIVEE